MGGVAVLGALEFDSILGVIYVELPLLKAIPRDIVREMNFLAPSELCFLEEEQWVFRFVDNSIPNLGRTHGGANIPCPISRRYYHHVLASAFRERRYFACPTNTVFGIN